MFSGFLENNTVHRACFRDTNTTFIPVRGEKFTPCLRVNRFHGGMSLACEYSRLSFAPATSRLV